MENEKKGDKKGGRELYKTKKDEVLSGWF